jgi:hypothetical protein
MNDLVRTILILVLAAGIAAVAFVTWRTGRRVRCNGQRKLSKRCARSWGFRR